MDGRILAVLALCALVVSCTTPGGLHMGGALVGAAIDSISLMRMGASRHSRITACIAALESFGYDVYLAEDLPSPKKGKR